MHVRKSANVAAALAGIAAVATAPLAAAQVPPGGLLTSFLGNQVTNCSAICGPLLQTGVTAAATTLQTPVAFLGALQSGDLGKAIGITAASVTGPTEAALAAAIDVDATVAVPKASNTLEVATVGLLDVVPAVAGGLPAVATAIEGARQKTFDALNLPVPVSGSTVMPHGVVDVTAVSAIRVGEAVVFPAFNDALLATVAVPNAAAQELATTGDPVRAVSAGANSAVASATAAVSVVSHSVTTGIKDVRVAEHSARTATVSQKPSGTAKHDNLSTGVSHPEHDAATKAARSVVKTSHRSGRHRVG